MKGKKAFEIFEKVLSVFFALIGILMLIGSTLSHSINLFALIKSTIMFALSFFFYKSSRTLRQNGPA